VDVCRTKEALPEDKIKKGFASTGIWPRYPSAMDSHMKPSQCYTNSFEGSGSDEKDDLDVAVEQNNEMKATIPEGLTQELKHNTSWRTTTTIARTLQRPQSLR